MGFLGKMSIGDICQNLRLLGFTKMETDGLAKAAAGKQYTGHRKCSGCGGYQLNEGMLMLSCDSCGWCRHASTTGSALGQFCDQCGMKDPPHVYLDETHHVVYMLDDNGAVVSQRTE